MDKLDLKTIIAMTLTIAVLFEGAILVLAMFFETQITGMFIFWTCLVSLLFGFLGAIDIYTE